MIFTCMHLVDTNLIILHSRYTFYELMHFLGIQTMTLVLLMPCFKLLYYSLKEHVERSDEEMFKVHSASQKDKQILSAATTQTHIGAPLQTESVGSLNSH